MKGFHLHVIDKMICFFYHFQCVLFKILPGVKVAIANPETRGQCGDSSLGEVRIKSLQRFLLSSVF